MFRPQDSTHLNDELTTRQGYKANFFSPGKEEFYQDINVTVERKIVKLHGKNNPAQMSVRVGKKDFLLQFGPKLGLFGLF